MPLTDQEKDRRQYQYEKACGNGMLDQFAKKIGIETTPGKPITKDDLLRKWTEKTGRRPAIDDVEMWRRINTPRTSDARTTEQKLYHLLTDAIDESKESRMFRTMPIPVDPEYVNDLLREGEA